MNYLKPGDIDRREFLKVVGVTAVAGTVIACSCNLENLVTPTPEPGLNAQVLQDQFGLTAIKARTFATFINNRNHHIGRRAIARQLGISLNTLKDHITKIILYMRVQSGAEIRGINDAVNVAVNSLGLNQVPPLG